MNFYKHHLGDYAQATAHLSFVEDAAYSRLIRKYYANEKPIPSDVKAAQRLVGARTKEEREAVETVLNEFFTLQEDGWHNKRCDSEIAQANAQAETNRRIAEEREARKRALREAQEQHEPQHDQSTNRETNRPTNRQPSQTPDTRHQTPSSSIPEVLRTSTDRQAESAEDGPIPCPQAEVLKLWATLMPELQQPVRWSGARATILRSRWREEAIAHAWQSKDDGLRFFAQLLRWCRRSDFLMGRGHARTPGQAPFALTLPWLLKAENFAKVQEGNYHPEEATA